MELNALQLDVSLFENNVLATDNLKVLFLLESANFDDTRQLHATSKSIR